jgi:tetratricopeptide (TPR) repeat protein
LNQRGVVLLELGRCDEALASFEHALAAEPTSLDAFGNCGNALLKLNRPSGAIAAYDRALAIVPHNAALLTNRAIALRKLDRPHEALMSVTRALASKPDFAQARFVDSLVRLTFLAGQKSCRATPQFSSAAVAGRRVSRGQDRSAPCRAGFWRHPPIRALCAACVRAGRQGRS